MTLPGPTLNDAEALDSAAHYSYLLFRLETLLREAHERLVAVERFVELERLMEHDVPVTGAIGSAALDDRQIGDALVRFQETLSDLGTAELYVRMIQRAARELYQPLEEAREDLLERFPRHPLDTDD